MGRTVACAVGDLAGWLALDSPPYVRYSLYMDTRTTPALQNRLAANVRAYRLSRGYSYPDAAERSGIAEITWRKIEAGERWAGPDILAGIAAALKVEPATLLREPTGEPVV